MNLKKFISGVSALTIAASAFAGMAVTASAAWTTIYTNDGTDNENWDTTGTVAVVAADAEGNIKNDAYLNTYGGGSGNRYARLSFPSSVYNKKSGIIKVSFDFYFTAMYGDQKNNAKAEVAINGNKNDVNSLTGSYYVGADWANATSNTYTTYFASNAPETTFTMGAGKWYTMTATINLDNKTFDASVKREDQTANTTSVTGAPFNADNLYNIYILNPRFGTTRSTYVDNVEVAYMGSPAKTLTLNYGAAGSKEIDVQSSSVGDEVPYTYPKYIVKGNTLYKSDATTYSSKRVLAAAEDSVDVAYTSQGTGTFVFADFDGTENAGASNGGYKTAIAKNQTPVSFTVPVDGKYSLEGYAYASATGRSIKLATGYNKDAITGEFYSGDISNVYGTTIQGSNLELKAGTTYYIIGSDSRAFIDYILLTKTADLPVALSSMATETVAGTDNSVGVIAKGTVNGVNTVDKLTITANGETKEKVRGTDYTFDTDLGGSSVEIAIIVLGVTSVTSIAIN